MDTCTNQRAIRSAPPHVTTRDGAEASVQKLLILRRKIGTVLNFAVACALSHTRCIVAPLLGYREPTRCCSSCSGTAVYVSPRQLRGFFTVTANIGSAKCTASL